MNNLNPEVKEYLESLGREQNAIMSYHGEYEIADKIKAILDQKKDHKWAKEDTAECIAFLFMADYSDDNFGWETYYGPMIVQRNDEGQFMECPSIKQIDEEILNYWTKRAEQCTNPILSSRYADLVVVFTEKILGKNADFRLFQTVINSNIDICEKSLADPLDCKTKIKRALILAILTGNEEQVNRTKDAVIQLENNMAEDDKLALWGFSFRWLLLEFSNKVVLNDKEKNALVNDMEEKLKKHEKNQYLMEDAVSLLAEYYAKEQDEKNLMRVLGVRENALKGNEALNSNALFTMNAYQQMQLTYAKYADKGFSESNEANKRLLREIGQLNSSLDWGKSLTKISVKINIEQEIIDDHLKRIFGNGKNDSLKTVMARIALFEMPRMDLIKKDIEDTSHEFRIRDLFSSKMISEDGVVIAEIPSFFLLGNDSKDSRIKDSHLKHQTSQYIQNSSKFLFFTMSEFRQRFGKEEVIEYFQESLVFENDHKHYLERAISAYWDKDYLVSSHLFIPSIEKGIRELVRMCGGSVLKVNGTNGYDNLTLTKIFTDNDEILKKAFSGKNKILERICPEIEHDILFYLKLVLIDKLGMNLRNNFAHGLCREQFFQCDTSDILFHILIMLSLFKR